MCVTKLPSLTNATLNKTIDPKQKSIKIKYYELAFRPSAKQIITHKLG